MRAAALFVWIFINLVCFGMCGYMYLIWSQYWLYIEKQRRLQPAASAAGGRGRLGAEPALDPAYPDSFEPERPAVSPPLDEIGSKRRRSAVGALAASRAAAGAQPAAPPPPVRSSGRPRFPNAHKPVLEFDSDEYACDDPDDADCRAKTAQFKELVVKELHHVLMAESDVFKSVEGRNAYEVRYDALRFGPYRDKSPRELLCELKRVPVRTVSALDEPFAAEGYRIARAPERSYDTCAVVSSAGALYGAGLGSFIDSHDMVLRFNNAPTDNFTDDVGARTTLRVLNSQVLTKPEFAFETSPLYRGVGLLVWDPAHYSASLEDWHRRPDFPFFEVYKRYLEKQPQADAHLLHPSTLWALWDFLQSNSPYRLRKNPPSSGFIGIWFALWRCARVRVAEFVPSTRATRRCHYYRARADAACTLGVWHPLAQEKALVERMRDGSDHDAFQRGYVELPGLSTVDC